MAEPHDEQWCDRQIAQTKRVLQYLQLRDSVIMERVHAAQLQALRQAEVTQRILLDFKRLLRGAAKYQAFLLDPQPTKRQSRRHTPERKHLEKGPSPKVQARLSRLASVSQDTQSGVSCAQRVTSANGITQMRDTLLESQSQAKVSPDTKAHKSQLKNPKILQERHVPSMGASQPSRRASQTPVTTQRRRVTSRSRVSSSLQPQSQSQPQPQPQPQPSIIARELSEARLKVLNRRKIIAERKKNAARTPPVSARQHQPPSNISRQIRDAENKSASTGVSANSNFTRLPLGHTNKVEHDRQAARLNQVRGDSCQYTAYKRPDVRQNASHSQLMGSRGSANPINAGGIRKGRYSPFHNMTPKSPLTSRPGRNVSCVPSDSVPPVSTPSTRHSQDLKKPNGNHSDAYQRTGNNQRDSTSLEVHIGPRRLIPSAARVHRPSVPQSCLRRSLHRIPETGT